MIMIESIFKMYSYVISLYTKKLNKIDHNWLYVHMLKISEKTEKNAELFSYMSNVTKIKLKTFFLYINITNLKENPWNCVNIFPL